MPGKYALSDKDGRESILKINSHMYQDYINLL